VVVELRDGDLCGYGEAPVIPYYGHTAEGHLAAVEAARPAGEAATWDRPEALWERLRPELESEPFALAAIDEAAHDLWARQLGRPLHELWGLSASQAPPCDFTIGLDRVEAMVAKLQAMPGWPAYKIKLGSADDVGIIRALRAHTDAAFRVDANTGWTLEHALHVITELADLGVELIEQPLPRDQWDAMKQLAASSPVPLIADESCASAADLERCADCFHGINVKLSKCGGLTPARRLILRARELDMKIMIGCMIESTVGVSAAAQIAAMADYADMDSPVLLARDLAEGVRFDRGRILYPDAPGCGVSPLPDAWDR
jgi:L-alanine-DL-glutamate epimerase-like enolase superfamily enzyme